MSNFNNQSQEDKARRLASKHKRKSDLLLALSKVLTTEWQDYNTMHHAVNAQMRELTGKKTYDAEFITLNAALATFEKSIHCCDG